MSCPIFSRASIAVLLFGVAAAAAAQEDLTLPPRFEEAPARQARLDAPAFAPPESDARDDDSIEEVVVVRENAWRLPDLGSEWRAEHEQEIRKTGRIRAKFLPLYDPAAERPMTMLFPVNRELTRAGFIEIFRVRFGGR